MIDTAVVIANWNGKKYLKDCLDPLAAQTYQNFKIVFVDNGSRDGSVDFVYDNYPETEIIELESNTGFAYPNNLGIKRAFEDREIKYIITLNNDTKVEPNFLAELINCSENNKNVGSIQPKVVNFFEKDRIDCVGIGVEPDGTGYNRGYREKDEGQHEEKKEVFGASACAALYKREVLEEARLSKDEYFDNDYFAYYEDTDLAWRIRLLGYKSFYCPKAKVLHIHSATAGNFSAFKAFHLHRNRLFTIIKIFPPALMAVAVLKSEFRYLVISLCMLKKRGRDREYIKKEGRLKLAGTVLKAWGNVLTNFPDLLKKRKWIRSRKKASNREIARWLRDLSI